MTDEKHISGEEVRRRERTAFCNGAEWQYLNNCGSGTLAEDEAKARYPIRREVPRKVKDCGGIDWHINSRGNVAYSMGEPSGCTITPERVRLWADLLANPTETIEE